MLFLSRPVFGTAEDFPGTAAMASRGLFAGKAPTGTAQASAPDWTMPKLSTKNGRGRAEVAPEPRCRDGGET